MSRSVLYRMNFQKTALLIVTGKKKVTEEVDLYE